MSLTGTPRTPSAECVDENDPPLRQPMPAIVRHDAGIPVVVLPAEMVLDDLREWIRERLPQAMDMIGGRACRLDLGARELQLFDLRRLIHLLRDEFSVDVTGLYVRPEAIHRYAERELKLKLFPIGASANPMRALEVPPDSPAEPSGIHHPPEDPAGPPTRRPARSEASPAGEPDATSLPGLAELAALLADGGADEATDEEPIPDVFEPGAAQRRIPMPDLPREEPEVDAEGGRRTLTVRRTLRSGAAISYDGDVFVLGDVNAGAQIRAGRNVIVLGRLRGVVHAGAQGDDEAFILAFDLAPTQLRIGKHIAIAPARPASEDGFTPELAMVEGGTIVIEPYKGRLRRTL